jgi:ketosteroid isomerase-like protein
MSAGAATGPGLDIVRRLFTAFREQDLESARTLLAPDFVFTSPQDDHIDRAAYLERCFPTADRFVEQRLLRWATTDDDVFVMYEYELRDGGRYRNAELITVRGGRVVAVQVFFGGAAWAGIEPGR